MVLSELCRKQDGAHQLKKFGNPWVRGSAVYFPDRVLDVLNEPEFHFCLKLLVLEITLPKGYSLSKTISFCQK